MALIRVLSMHSLALACCGMLVTGCVTTTETTSGSVGLSRNYPADSPSGKNGAKKSTVALRLPYAKLQENEGNYDKARSTYKDMLAENPKSLDAIVGIARLDQLAGRIPDAERGYQQAIKLNPKSPMALDALGQFYVSQSRWEDAIRTMNQAMQLAPEEKIYRFHLAMTYAKAGRIPESMPHFTQSVGEAEGHYNIGFMLHEKGDLQAAEEQFRLAVIQKPDLKQAQVWLDEVRREQETQLALATGPGAGKGHNAALTSATSGGNGFQNGLQRDPRSNAGGPQPPANRQSQARTATPQNNNWQDNYAAGPQINAGSASQPSTPTTWPTGRNQAPPNADQVLSQQMRAQQQGTNTPLTPTGAQNPATGMTPEQWEQRNNQRALGETTSAFSTPVLNTTTTVGGFR